jgi:hypothetical protein
VVALAAKPQLAPGFPPLVAWVWSVVRPTPMIGRTGCTGSTMNLQNDAASAATRARIIGALYIVIIVVGVLGQALVRDGLIVSGDAAATAANLRASETLWRASVSAELAYLVLAVIVDVLLYGLFRPVDRTIALLGFGLNLVSISVEVIGRFLLLVPLVFLGSGRYLQAFEPAQLQAIAYAFLRLHDLAFGLALIFFGGVCVCWGYLIRHSRFLPGPIGWLMQLAGACYLTNSFALLLAPRLASALFPAILLPAFIAESCLALWLLFRGVDTATWRAAHNEARPHEVHA